MHAISERFNQSGEKNTNHFLFQKAILGSWQIWIGFIWLLTFPATKHLNSEASSISCVQVKKLTSVSFEHFTINSCDPQRKE